MHLWKLPRLIISSSKFSLDGRFLGCDMKVTCRTFWPYDIKEPLRIRMFNFCLLETNKAGQSKIGKTTFFERIYN